MIGYGGVGASLMISIRSGEGCDADGTADVVTVGERLLGTTVLCDDGECVFLSSSPAHGRVGAVSVTGVLQGVCPTGSGRVSVYTDVGGETGGKV